MQKMRFMDASSARQTRSNEFGPAIGCSAVENADAALAMLTLDLVRFYSGWGDRLLPSGPVRSLHSRPLLSCRNRVLALLRRLNSKKPKRRPDTISSAVGLVVRCNEGAEEFVPLQRHIPKLETCANEARNVAQLEGHTFRSMPRRQGRARCLNNRSDSPIGCRRRTGFAASAAKDEIPRL